jgi:hypothetical protein
MNEQHARARLDRRTLVRAGVWTVPVVAVAVAAPALAVSGTGNAVLQLNWLSVYGADFDGKGKPTTVESQTAVQDVWQDGVPSGGPTLTQITLVVSYQNKVSGAAPTLVNGTGWSFASANGTQYTFVWTGSLTPGNSTPTLTWRVPLKNSSSGSISVQAYATAGGAISPTVSASNNL